MSQPSTDFPPVLTRYADMVETALRSAVPEGAAPLYRAMRYHMGWADAAGAPIPGARGKRLRPILCLMACEAAGGSAKAAISAAVALELVHNFSLVHDDVQDQDRERHQRPTIWALWGEPQALIVGNAFYALACGKVLEMALLQVTPDLALRAAERLVQSSLEMLQGQYLDLEFERRIEVTPQEYLGMIALKTGALMACAMELGAMLGSGSDGLVSIFVQAGRNIGQLFQLRDDVLGIWGDSAVTGKAVYTDIWRKKKTFPVVHALQNSSKAAAKELREIYGKESLSEDDVRRALEVLEATRARQEAATLAGKLAEQALAVLRAAELSPRCSREMEALVSFLLSRDR